MLENALTFISEYEANIKDQSKYLNDTDWSSVVNFPLRKLRRAEYELHYKLLSTFVTRLKYVLQEAGEGALENKKIKKFSETISEEVNNYIERVNNYFKSERWQDYEDPSEKSDEIDLQDDILKDVLKMKDLITALNLNNEQKNVILPLYGNPIISLAMRKTVEARYPEVKSLLENRKQE